MKLTIAKQLMVGFAVVLALFAGMSAFIVVQEQQISEITEEVASDDVPGALAYMKLLDIIGDLNSDLFLYVSDQVDNLDSFQASKADLFVQYERLYELEVGSQPEQMAEIERLINNWLTGVDQQVLADNVGWDKQFIALAELSTSQVSQLESLLERGATEESNDSAMAMGDVADRLAVLSLSTIVVTIISLALAIAIVWALARSIRLRLGRVIEQASAIAKGDLSRPEMSVQRLDEIGQVSLAINDMQRALVTLIGEIKNTSTQVMHTSNRITALNNDISQSSDEQAQRAQQIATAANEMSHTIEEVSKQSNQALSLAEDAGESAQKGGGTVKHLVNSIQDVATTMSELSHSVGSLGKRSESIGDVIKVITDIAEQTNLLALNAAIEAARAGEQGRGFAVVADEVRGLAERTAKATQEVSSSISAIQDDTQSAVSRMQESSKVVDSGVALSNDALSALTDIVAQAQQVKDVITSVATAAEQQTSVTQEINQDIHQIAELASQSTGATGEAGQYSQDLANQVNQLDAMVAKFKV